MTVTNTGGMSQSKKVFGQERDLNEEESHSTATDYVEFFYKVGEEVQIVTIDFSSNGKNSKRSKYVLNTDYLPI